MVARSIDRRSTAGRLLDLVFELHDQKRISRVEAETIIDLAEQGWSTEAPAPERSAGGQERL